MKNKNLIILASILSLTVLFSSCKKEEVAPATNTSTPAPAPVPSEPFYAKVDGVEFVETSVTGDVSGTTGTLSIEATGPNNTLIRVKMPYQINPGTYSFESPDLGVQGGYYNDGNSIYGAPTGTGTLTVSSNTPATIGNPGEISGFFTYNAEEYSFSSGTDSYAITEGEFVVSYQ